MTSFSELAAESFVPFPPVTGRPLRLGVLISGGGTTLLNFLDQIRCGALNADIVQVIATRESCAGVARATAAGLPCTVIRPREFPSVQAFSEAVFGSLRDVATDLVTLAGFLSLVEIPDDFRWRVVNIHPALIPAFCGHGFYGHHVHQAAIDRGVKVSGCTVHFADNLYDHGPIILQRTVTVPDQSDAEQLAALVFQQEQIAYPEAVRLLSAGRVRIAGSRTIIS